MKKYLLSALFAVLAVCGAAAHVPEESPIFFDDNETYQVVSLVTGYIKEGSPIYPNRWTRQEGKVTRMTLEKSGDQVRIVKWGTSADGEVLVGMTLTGETQLEGNGNASFKIRLNGEDNVLILATADGVMTLTCFTDVDARGVGKMTVVTLGKRIE